MSDHILVVDFGGQYAHLIASKIRRLNYYTIVCYPDDINKNINKNTKGIILSGGGSSVYENGPTIDKNIFNLDIPILGICYGMQLMAHLLNGSVKPANVKEYGETTIKISEKTFLFNQTEEIVWMSHGDEVVDLPNNFISIASSNNCKNVMITNNDKLFGVQFHPEVNNTRNGNYLLTKFVEFCNMKKNWNIDNYYKSMNLPNIGDSNILVFVSGGVDSCVAFTLLSKHYGIDRVFGVFVDTGLMRKDEINEIKNMKLNLHIEDASELFYNKLNGVYDPEKKREIIGNLFVELKDIIASKMKLGDNYLLAQGTIYPDTIESGGTKHSTKIKTHHNRVPIINKLIEEGKVIEPLKDLYKDEVRYIGKLLNMHDSILNRHPFPGPALGIRIINNYFETKDDVLILDNLNCKLLPIKAVGVQGDNRTYRNALGIFSDYNKLNVASLNKLTGSLNDINRVLVCVSHNTPQKFIPSPNHNWKNDVLLLQHVDNLFTNYLTKYKLYDDIWQAPIVLLPFGNNGGKSIVIRPINSIDGMTAEPYLINHILLNDIVENMLKIKGIDMIFYDFTTKPPATIEFE